MLASSLASSSTLKMEVIRSLRNIRLSLSYTDLNPNDRILHSYSREYLKSNMKA